MARLYLRVDFDADILLDKLKEIDVKTEELEQALYEFKRLCGQVTAESEKCENEQEQKNN